MSRNMRRPICLASGLAVLATALAPAAGAAPADKYYERAVMLAVNDRCAIFRPAVAMALSAAALQARGAALRAGTEREVLHAVEQRARARAGSLPCASSDIAVASQRVEAAFEGWTRLPRMTFPGAAREWRADRTLADRVRWRLTQQTRLLSGDAAFGLAGRGDRAHLIAVGAFQDGAPYAARLIYRDASRAPHPWLDRSAALRTRPASRVVLAEARSSAGGLADGEDAVAFRFPARSAAAIAALDPREFVTIEFVFSGASGKEQVRAARFEVGDFAAGRAFIAAGRETFVRSSGTRSAE